MADKPAGDEKNTSASESTKTAQKQRQTPAESRLPKSVWVENSTSAFNTRPEIISAALKEGEYTRDEVVAAVKKFLSTPVV